MILVCIFMLLIVYRMTTIQYEETEVHLCITDYLVIFTTCLYIIWSNVARVLWIWQMDTVSHPFDTIMVYQLSSLLDFFFPLYSWHKDRAVTLVIFISGILRSLFNFNLCLLLLNIAPSLLLRLKAANKGFRRLKKPI